MLICDECGTPVPKGASWCLKCGPEIIDRRSTHIGDVTVTTTIGRRPATRRQMEQAGLATPGQSHCSEEENNCEQDEGA